MADRTRTGDPDENPEPYDNREKRWYGTGYWTNEPNFIESRRKAFENEREKEHGPRPNRPEGDEHERDENGFRGEDFYRNRGWTRSAAQDRRRSWGYTPGHDYTRGPSGQAIDYEHNEYWRDWASPGRRSPESEPNQDPNGPWYGENRLAKGLELDRSYSRAISEGRQDEWIYQRDRERQDHNRQVNHRQVNHRDRDERGPYAGAGPQGYSRPDSRILEDVCERLEAHGEIDARAIQIKVENGQVLLEGNVDRKNEKRLAEDVAHTVSGVKEVENRLRVNKNDRR